MRHSLGCERSLKKGSASCAGTLQGTKQLLVPIAGYHYISSHKQLRQDVRGSRGKKSGGNITGACGTSNKTLSAWLKAATPCQQALRILKRL